MRRLVEFDPNYYIYPTSICRGSRYPLDVGLSLYDQEARTKWLQNVERLARTRFHDRVFSRYGGMADYSVFRKTMCQHGLFAERFFHLAVRHRVLAEMVADPDELADLKALVDEAWGYDIPFSRQGSLDVYRVVDHLFEQHLYRAIADPGDRGILAAWYETYSQPRACEVCGSPYRLIDFPDWVYAGSNGAGVCCMRCNIVDRPRKKALLPHVRAFVEECGFIPPANAGPITHSFTCRLLPGQWAAVFSAYGQMGGIDNVKAKWSSWFAGLASSGALPDGVIATSRGVRCLAKDGHECHSLDEQRIDDWLGAHNVAHEREPVYPEHPLLNPRGRRRADWRVGDVYVEYFGLTGEKAYDMKTDEKIMLTKQLGITMLPIYPSDMASLDESLRSLFQEASC